MDRANLLSLMLSVTSPMTYQIGHNSITTQLVALGYASELFYLEILRHSWPPEKLITLFDQHKIVRRPTPLTFQGELLQYIHILTMTRSLFGRMAQYRGTFDMLYGIRQSSSPS